MFPLPTAWKVFIPEHALVCVIRTSKTQVRSVVRCVSHELNVSRPRVEILCPSQINFLCKPIHVLFLLTLTAISTLDQKR